MLNTPCQGTENMTISGFQVGEFLCLSLFLIPEIKCEETSWTIRNKHLPQSFSIMLPYLRHDCDYQITLNQQEYTSEDYVLCKAISFTIAGQAGGLFSKLNNTLKTWASIPFTQLKLFLCIK